MIELKIRVEDNIVQLFGYKELERQLHEYVSNLYLKIAAKEMQKGIAEIDLENDEKWQVARELAWDQEKHKYGKFLGKND